MYSALTSTYIATKKEKKKKTPQESVRSSLEESSVSGPTWGKHPGDARRVWMTQ